MKATIEIPIANIEMMARSTVFTAIVKSPYNYILRLLFEIKFQEYLRKRKEVCFKSLPRLLDDLKRDTVHGPRDYATRLNPPKIANNAKNIVIGRMEITVHAIDFALRHASLPSGFAVESGQSMDCSTSE